MAKKKTNSTATKLNSRFDIGQGIGETDSLLDEVFIETPLYEVLESQNRPSAFVIGRTGSGKSATFRRLKERFPDRVIQIRPEDLALPYVSNSDVVVKLIEKGIHMEPFFKPLWQRIFVTEIVHHRFKDKSPDAKLQFIHRIKEFFLRNPSKKRLLGLMDELEEDFWCTTEERVVKNLERLSQQLQEGAGIGGRFGVGIPGIKVEAEYNPTNGTTREWHNEWSSETLDKVQHIVNQSELARIKELITLINEQVIDSKQNFSYLLIDDLDRFWVDERVRLTLLRCLFEAVVDMVTAVPNLKILVALRSNIFVQMDYASQRYGLQEEKIEEMTLYLKWSYADIEELLDQRVRVASGHRNFSPPLTLKTLLPNVHPNRDPLQYLLDRTLLRPRDAILYLKSAIELADGKPRLSWDHLRVAEEIYSKKRFDALRDEWKDPFFGIENVLEAFRHAPILMTWEQVKSVLDDVVLEASVCEHGEAPEWLESCCREILEHSDVAPLADRYYSLVNILFEIGFLGLTTSSRAADPSNAYLVQGTYFYQLPGSLTKDDITSDVVFAIHPAFRKYLQCGNVSPAY